MKANKASPWVGDSGDGRFICNPVWQDSFSCVIAIPCSFTRALLRGSGALWRDQGQAGGSKCHLPDLPSLPTGCLSAPITATTISDPLLLINYSTSKQLDLCLSNEVLKANLEPLLEQPLPVEYLRVVKKKLEQVMGDAGQEPLRSPPLAWARSGTGETRCGNGHRRPRG